MNKIFKVVWSKTKECYVVVSEVAKNNGGKKKVLASVLAGLAMVGAGAAGTPVQAVFSDSGSSINVYPNAKTGNYVGSNAVVVGFENRTDADVPGTDQLGRVIYGTGNIGAGNSALAVGNNNEARGSAVVAIGHGSNAKAKQSVALGNVARAEKDGTVAIGTYVNAETTNVGTATVPKYNTKETGAYSTAVGAFSWTKGDYSAAYGYQAEATGTNAVAIGRVSKATGTSATAVGVNNKAQAQDSTAVGSSNTIDNIATQASAFGRENTVNRDGSIAAGYKNTAVGQRNVAIGNQNTTAGEETIGIGTKVIAGTGKTIAIGGVYNPGGGVEKQTIARGNDTINAATGQVNNIFALAIGNGAQADGKAKSASGMIAIGQDVTADNNNTVAIGVQTKATGNNALAVGSTAQAIGTSSAAFGTQAVANGTGATAFGPGSSAGTGAVTADGSVAVGRKATVTAAGGVGIGWTASASEKNATAIGFSATASGVQSVAIGGGDEYDYPGTERGKHFTTASGKSSVAVGSYAKATEENAMAFGTDANANIAGGVALGSESKTTTAAGVQGYNPASDRTNKYSTQGGAVGTSTLAAVSIGDGSDKTRQLTGLAAGTADTDAVNVAQLKNVNLKYAGDTGNSDVLLKDGTLKVKGDNNFISTSADGTGITVTAKIGNPITANAAGKAEAPATNGLATTTNVADAINASGWNVVSSNNGGSVTGTQATKLVNPGNTVTLSAGKNIVLDQNDKQFTYSLNKDVDLTNAGSLTIGDTKVTNGGLTITGGPSITKTGIDAGSKKITNVTAGTADTDAVNVKQLKDTEKHIKPGTYAVANDGSVTLKYVDGNGTEQTETAKITGIAKKSKVINGQNTTVEEGTDTTDNSVTYKVNVKGDLADISSITNGTGSGKISFEGDQVVKVGGDHPISFDGKGGYVTGLQNKDWDITNPTVVSGRAATEDQLKKVSDGFNNTVKLTGNSGATGTQKLNQNGGLSFGVVGADNGKYITTTASGSNVVADLSTDAKAKLNSKVVVAGSGAATVGTPTVTTNPDGSTVTTYTVHVDPATATAASTESVVKKAVTGDTNIADVSVADGKATGDVGAKYEVSVSRNAVKDAAREAVTVNNGGTTTGGTYTADTNNPITVNPVKDDTNHNTTYEVKFDGAKAAKVIPLTYKANGAGDKTVTLEKGLNFTNGTNTTAEIGNDGVVKYNLNKDVDLSNTGSLTVGDTKVTNGGVTITAPAGGTTSNVTLTQSGLDNGGNKIINVAPGTLSSTSTDAVNGSQLYTVNQKFNNKINLGADGSTETTKFALDNTGGIKFNIKGDGSGASGANQYISTTANGSNVNVDLTADAKAKLNKTYTVSSGSTNVTVTPTTTGDNTDFKITVASTGTTTSSSWNLATDKVSATEGTVAAGSAATQNIADTKTVTMQAGKNLTVKQTNDGAGNASVAYSLDKDISVENITVTGQNGKDGSIGINGKDGVTRNITVEVPGQAGQPGTPGVDGTTTTRIVFDGKAQANLDDGLKFTGNNESTENKHKLNTLVKVQGEGTKEGTDAAGAKEIQTSDGTKFESAKDNIAVEANGADTLTVKLNKNLKGLDSVTTKEIKLGDANDNISIKKDGDRITYTTNNGGTTTTNKVANLGDELHITPGTYEIGATNKDAAAKNDEVTLTYTDGNGVEKANTFAKIKGVAKSDLSNISNDGKKVITGLGSVVKAGDNVTVKTDTDATTGQKTYTVNAVTPAVYTKADGTKVIKRPDGTFTTNLDGSAGNDVPASDVIVSFQDAAGNTTGGNSIVNNVGSAIDKTGTSTGDTFLTKLDNAATATPNAAVNVKDLKNTSDAIIGKGLKFDANEGGEKTNKLGSKVTVQGTGTLTAGKAYADEYNTANIRTNIEQGTDGNTTINVGLAKALKDINSISNGGSSITISDVPAGATTPAVTISGGNLSMGDGTTNNKIVNLAPGTDGTDAVNLNQLKGMRTVVTSTDKSVTVTSNENSTTGQVTYDLKVATTGTVSKSTWDLKSGVASATEGTHSGDTTQTIADTKSVTMQAGKNLTVKQTNDTAGNASVAYSLDKDISVETVTVTGQNGKDGSIGINGKDGVTRNITVEVPGQAGQPGTPGVDGTTTTRIVFDGKAQANLDDGLKFTGNNESTENKHKLNTLVKVQGEGTKEGTDAAGAKEIQTSDGTKFESAKDNIAVEANGADTLTVKLNKNLKGLDSVTTKEIKLGDANDNISIKKDGDRITYTTNNGGTTTTNKVANLGDELHITPGTYEIGATNKDAAAKNDEVTLTYTDGNGVEKANTFAKIKGVAKSDLSNISNDGKKVITGLGSVVKAGDNVTVKTDTDATTGQKTYTVNAVTPAVYTKADGTKVIKRPDGTFTTNLDGSAGNDVPASDVIVSFQDAAGDTKLGNSIVNNVGSAIDKPGTATGNTFLTQLDNAAANTPFAAVNVRDLKTTADALKANERHIAPTTVATGSTETKGGTANAAGTANVYKYDATSKTVTLTYNDGNGNAVTDTKAVIDLSNLSTGGTGASSWNIASDKVSATEGAVATGSAGTQNIADGKTVTMKAGKNLTVNQSNDGAGNASVAFSLDKNLENLDKVVVNGNDGATGQAGVSIVGPKGANGVDGNDGKVGIAGKDGKDAVSISGKDGVGHIGLQGPKGTPGTPGMPGTPGASLDISTDHGTQTLVKPERNNNNQSERIVYVPKDANGNPLKDTDGNDIKREVATMDDGLKFTGNNESTENKQKLGSLVKVQGEGTKESTAVDPATGKKYVVLSDGTTKFESAKDNIAVEADGTDTLTVKLNKNLKGLNSIQLGGNTIQSNGDNITFTTNGGTTKTVATTDQLWTIQANGTDVPAKSGKVNLVAGDHITITPDAANGKMTISATGFGSMDGFNVKTSAESATVGTHAGDTTENIKNGKTVDMQAGKNLVVTQSNDGNGNTTVNYALNKDVNLGNDGSLKTGDTTINNDGFKNGNTTVGGNGMTIKNPTDPTKTVSLTKDGLNNGGNQITNVASGGNVDTNAANIGDIKRLAKDTRIKDGTYTVDNNGTVELTYVDGAGNQVKDASGNAITAKITGLTTLDSTRVNVAVNETGSGKAVGSKAAVKVTKGTEFVAGDNLIVERKANAGTDVDNSVVYSLNKDLKGIETIKNGNTTITLHNNPTTATDPTAVTITGGNINMGGNRIVNVAPAKAGTDAVNLDQLKAARTHVTSKDGTVTVTPTEDKTTGQMTYDLHVTPGQSPDLTRITNKVDQLGEEIGRVGAQGAALSALKPIQYDPLEPTQIMAGYGNYRGNSAVALGVAHYKNESTLIHGGVSWAGGSSHMMANAGVTWKVGNRDSEAAVADRYRKGPISSAYAMQQEMAAMKAQNAGLKGEVSDLKAENEQMKAQIAAMMAKLGL